MASADTNSNHILKSYLQGVSKIPLLTPLEEQNFATLSQGGNHEAHNTLVLHNLRLVLKIALRYVNRGLSLEDLVEEGNLGLIQASKKFDPARKCRFSTYAVPWIDQSIQRALINQGSSVRLPIYLAQKINRFKKAQKQLSQSLLREAHFTESLDSMEPESTSSIHNLQAFEVVSIHNPKSEGLNLLDQEHLSYAKSDDYELNLIEQETKHQLMAALAQLSENEQAILVHRFGLDGSEPKTLEETSKLTGYKKENIRRQQVKAMERLRTLL